MGWEVHMDKAIVRIMEITLTNFRNVRNGKVSFPNYFKKDYFLNRPEIVGIYGQNGSGKTAVVDALQFFKALVTGAALRSDAGEFIYFKQDKAEVSISLSVQHDKAQLFVYYSFSIKRNSDHLAYISNENVKYRVYENNKMSRLLTIIDYDAEIENNFISPNSRVDEIVGNSEKNLIELLVVRELALKERTSFLFSNKAYKIITNSTVSDIHKSVLGYIQYFATFNLFVVDNRCSAISSLDLFLPINFTMFGPSYRTGGSLPVKLSEPTILSKELYGSVKNVFKQMNIVMKTIIPGLTISIKEYGQQLLEKGEEGFRFELVSNRNGTLIPLKYESDGTKKIISILSTLIAVFNRPNICVVIDELDAGVFEFMLGELLQILEQNGQGQLLFTSHNLRPLEMLNKQSIIFTTANPDNRYVRFSNIKTNNNLRDYYLREINLGGQKEIIYDETNRYEISNAFERAGEDIIE
jgi:AAA15 family ATPase/GTPase